MLRSEFKLDLIFVSTISLLIAFAADQLNFMTMVVPTLMWVRLGLWSRLPSSQQRHSIRAEIIFFLICILLGGFNDWNSVVNKQIYDYTVPVYFPEFSTIPIWMLLYWGMILRFMVSLFRIPDMLPLKSADNRLFGPAPISVPWWLRVSILLIFVLVTRQAIYHWYMDPLLSWIPFAAAIVIYPLLFPSGKAELRLGFLALVVGPLVEALYIKVGGLHMYHHPVLGGVPLWIMLWWILIIPIWRDLSIRIIHFLDSKNIRSETE